MIELTLANLAPPMTTWSGPARTWLPDARALAEACATASRQPASQELQRLCGQMGAPGLDVFVTLMSSRAAVLGLSTGRAFVHHELRGRIPMPKALEPEVAVWSDGTVPVWVDGVFQEPKYFSFFQDAPLPVFNPNHGRKWRAHELLHAAQGFFWGPEMTRFELYLGSRLNELLPVVHWYGFDEAFRPRCLRHQGSSTPDRYCHSCEQAAVPYWEVEAGDVQLEVVHFERALDHFSSEWAAAMQELSTGRRVVTKRPGLDASSDAVGYLKGHWNRLTAWSFGAWAERFLVEGVDHFTKLDGYAAQIAATARRLTSGTLRLDPLEFEARRARRGLQDMAYRAYLLLEWFDEGSVRAERAEGVLMPVLERTAQSCADLLRDSSTDPSQCAAQLSQALRMCAPMLTTKVRAPVIAVGHAWSGVDPEEIIEAALPQLVEGAKSALPLTSEAEGPALEALVRDFALSNALYGLGRFGLRFAEFLQATDHPSGPLANFEAMLAVPPRQDEDAELFAVVPDSLEDLKGGRGTLRANRTLRRWMVSRPLAERVLGESFEGELAAIISQGEPRVMPLDDETTQVLDEVASGRPPGRWLSSVSDKAVEVLLENLFLVWLPHPSV